MEEEKLYSIREVSEISNVCTDTPRCHDQPGLLYPDAKNSETFYRC